MRKLFLACAVLLIVSFNVHPLSAAPCENLAGTKLQDTVITIAETVAAGAFTLPAAPRGRGAGPLADAFRQLPAFCRIAATLTPSSDSDIKIEIWLPISDWNGKFQAVGNGGWTGNIPYPQLAAAVQRGYAVAATDTGHQGPSGSFALGHPEKLIDFAYRAVHEMTVKAKAVTEAFYNSRPKYSYWLGCSSGGKQGLKEAQKFPDDFDGIIAGAPANNWTHLTAGAAWVGQVVNKTESSNLSPATLPLLHDAAIKACDSLDGVKDGVIENPKKCKFDPAVLQCKGGDATTCLSPAQIQTARAIYAGLVNPRTKQRVLPGLEPSSESGWGFVGDRQPTPLGIDHYKYVVFKDPNWDYKTMDFDRDIALADKLDESVGINATDTNLKAFFGHGGKLLQFHGWTDELIPPETSIDYYKSVADAMGGANKVKNNYRLFMVPGMNHCGGGDGPSNFDPLATLEQWVEKGKAPDQIITAKPGRTRPLCPYPQTAVYKGNGSTDEASNFVCK